MHREEAIFLTDIWLEEDFLAEVLAKWDSKISLALVQRFNRSVRNWKSICNDKEYFWIGYEKNLTFRERKKISLENCNLWVTVTLLRESPNLIASNSPSRKGQSFFHISEALTNSTQINILTIWAWFPTGIHFICFVVTEKYTIFGEKKQPWTPSLLVATFVICWLPCTMCQHWKIAPNDL